MVIKGKRKKVVYLMSNECYVLCSPFRQGNYVSCAAVAWCKMKHLSNNDVIFDVAESTMKNALHDMSGKDLKSSSALSLPSSTKKFFVSLMKSVASQGGEEWFFFWNSSRKCRTRPSEAECFSLLYPRKILMRIIIITIVIKSFLSDEEKCRQIT